MDICVLAGCFSYKSCLIATHEFPEPLDKYLQLLMLGVALQKEVGVLFSFYNTFAKKSVNE